MAHHYEKTEYGTELVYDTFQEGIADAPEQGTAFLRNINLISIPGEAPVNYATSAITTPPTVTGASCTTDTATHSVTWTPTATLYAGCAITFGSTAGGVTAGNVYWVGNVSGSTFKVYTNMAHDQLVNVTDASNTFTVVAFGQPSQKTLDYIGTAASPNNVFIIDTAGRAWWIATGGFLVHMGNTTLTGAHGNGICALGNYLYVFRDAKIDYIPIDAITNSTATAGQWGYNWQSITTPTASTNYSHFALAAQDNGMYYCNAQTVGSVLATSGNNTIDPTNAATYTPNSSALLIPQGDRTTCLAELGTLLLVGGIQNKVYPWDRVSTSYNYPIILAENMTTRMVTTNATAFIFAGNRGRIYQTNGSNVQLYKKIPDHIVGLIAATNGPDPYYTWLDATYWKNQLYFSFTVTKNDGTAIGSLGGVWAIDVSASIPGASTSVALRLSNSLSPGSSAYAYVIAPNITSTTPSGAGLYIAWVNSGTYGVDGTSSSPYTSGTYGEVYTDLVPTGTAIAPKTFSQVEFKLSEPMVSGESVRISARQSYSDSFTVLGTNSTTGAVSGTFPLGTENGQWMQLFAELSSTSSSPSFVRLYQLRVR